MRKMTRAIFPFFWESEDDQTLKIVTEYHQKYKQVDELLQNMPEVLQLVHDDLIKMDNENVKSREADFTSENLFRALVLMQTEGWVLRETTVRINDSEFFQKFCRLSHKQSIDFTLIDKAFLAIESQTWEIINQHFAIRMKHEGKIDVETIRTDTTVTECNIHYPTDSSLLWDVYRTCARQISKARDLGANLTAIRFHLKKVKKLYLNVTRFISTKDKKRKRWVKKQRRLLIKRVRESLPKVKQAIFEMMISLDPMIQGIGQSLSDMMPSMEQIVSVADRNFKGETVPVTDKVFSLFEPHTELIKRGRRGKPVEFGHKILFSETKEKFITDFVVYEKCPSDTTLLPEVMERHEELFGEKIDTLAADKGFCPDADEYEELEEEVGYLAVPQRTSDLADEMMKVYQSFRAGIEGTISCLKRAYRLSRCCFRGFKGFCSAVGSAVFCHNLMVMANISKQDKKT